MPLSLSWTLRARCPDCGLATWLCLCRCACLRTALHRSLRRAGVLHLILPHSLALLTLLHVAVVAFLQWGKTYSRVMGLGGAGLFSGFFNAEATPVRASPVALTLLVAVVSVLAVGVCVCASASWRAVRDRSRLSSCPASLRTPRRAWLSAKRASFSLIGASVPQFPDTPRGNSPAPAGEFKGDFKARRAVVVFCARPLCAAPFQARCMLFVVAPVYGPPPVPLSPCCGVSVSQTQAAAPAAGGVAVETKRA